ncbi:MAG: hypothetical protein ACXVUE_24085 [Solirubrobacteraceae bacterium]
MTTLQHHRRITRATPGTVLRAGLIIVVAVAALLLTFNRTSHAPTPTTHSQTPSPYPPAIQTQRAGVAHIVVNPRTGQAHGTVTPATTHTQAPSPYLPTIQPHGARVAHLVVDPRTGQAHGTVTAAAARAS